MARFWAAPSCDLHALRPAQSVPRLHNWVDLARADREWLGFPRGAQSAVTVVHGVAMLYVRVGAPQKPVTEVWKWTKPTDKTGDKFVLSTDAESLDWRDADTYAAGLLAVCQDAMPKGARITHLAILKNDAAIYARTAKRK